MYSYTSEWIHRHETILHWLYYWHQIDLIRSVLQEGDRILEIGVGTKFTSNYLKNKGYEVVTLDIDKEKKPDIVANIVESDIEEQFDHIIAFEVFEHIPFEDFKKVLLKLHGVCRKTLLISIPRNEKQWLKLSVELPGRKRFSFRIVTKRRKIISRYHHWEVDYTPFTKRIIENVFIEKGYQIGLRRRVSSIYYYMLTKGS